MSSEGMLLLTCRDCQGTGMICPGRWYPRCDTCQGRGYEIHPNKFIEPSEVRKEANNG